MKLFFKKLIKEKKITNEREMNLNENGKEKVV